MARYNLIQIDSTYLTTNGMSGGSRFKTEIAELDQLQLEYGGNTVVALSGTPYTFLAEALGPGVPITITVATMTDTIFDAIKASIADAVDGEDTVPVVITGELGTFDLNCLPRFSEEGGPIKTPGHFRNGYIFDVQLRFVIESVNS